MSVAMLKVTLALQKSILLAGAVSLVVMPLLKENGIESLHENLAKRSAEFSGIDLKSLSEEELGKVVSKGIGYYRFAYNALKHAGMRKLKPSEELTFDADLKEEAYLLIDAVIIDFNHLPLSQTEINNLSPALLTLLQSNWYFPSLDVHGPITCLNPE